MVLGFSPPLQTPGGYPGYTAVMILAALDSVLGAVKAWLNGNFENKVFISGLLVNSLAAGALTYPGGKLRVAVYFAPIVALRVRIFYNLAVHPGRLLLHHHQKTLGNSRPAVVSPPPGPTIQ